MTENAVMRRATSSMAQKIEARERTDQVARTTIEEERRRRDAETERLRDARMQAEQQARQL